MSLKTLDIDLTRTAPFRFKKFPRSYLLTNETGDHVFLSERDFRSFVSGAHKRLQSASSQIYGELAAKNFIRDKLDVDAYGNKFRLKNSFLLAGPSLHIMVVTLRCDHRCLYCQSNSGVEDARHIDMDKRTAAKTVDMIFASPGKDIAIEFQGGEPLLNFPVIKYVIEYAEKKNRTSQKDLKIILVTNFGPMTQDIADYLFRHGVSVCTSLDGPAFLHNKNRPTSKFAKGSHANTVRWLRIFQKKAKARGNVHRPEALLTVTKDILDHPREVVDEYVGLGLKGIFLRPVSTFALNPRAQKNLSYSPQDFMHFYREAFLYILKLNREGHKFAERKAQIFLSKIYGQIDPNFLDLRSPCGAGIGQIAYDHNGDVYTCDEGRMLARNRDFSFAIGNVFDNTYEEVASHPTAKALTVASCLDNLPGCSECAYKPYCGLCPLMNYAESGSLFLSRDKDPRCFYNMKTLDLIFNAVNDLGDKEKLLGWLDPN